MRISDWSSDVCSSDLVEFIKAGYSVRDIELGRPKHIFYHVGDLVVEVAEQKDPETGYPVAQTINDQPHFAFGTTAEGLLKFADHLRRHGIPFDGPRSHRGMSAASVYFRDVDGNNLEVSTWEDVPEEHRSEEHTSELQSLIRISYACFC